MSLTYYNQPQALVPAWEGERQKAHRDMAMLNRYLAILEDNKRACRFIPDEVALSLEMAGTVRDRLEGRRNRRVTTTARLALALIQPEASGQLQ